MFQIWSNMVAKNPIKVYNSNLYFIRMEMIFHPNKIQVIYFKQGTVGSETLVEV